MNSTTAWMLANGYTDDSLDGGGALKGKNCTIEKIEKDGLNNIVTFKWTLDDGTIKRSTLTVKDGENLEISELEGNALVLKDDGLYVAKGSVEISKEDGNIIKSKADGLYAKADEIKVDPDSTNILENREDGLYVPDDYVKKEDGKSLVADEDIEQIETNKTAIEVLNGDAETAGSVDKKLADAIATLNKLEKKILDHIPTVEEAKDNVLYMVQSETAGTYNQYMLIDGIVANLGSTEVDLDGYAKTEDVVLLQQAIVDKDKVMAIGEDGKVAPIKLDIPTKVEELEDAEDYAKVEALDDYVTIQQSVDDKGKALVVGEDGKLAPSEVEIDSPSWSGTKAEFSALDKSTLKDGQQINITDDSDKSLIDDSKATADNVWSAEKVSASLGELSDALEDKADKSDVVPINNSTYRYLYQNTTKEYLTSSGKTLTASKTGLLQVMILKEKSGNSVNVAINGVNKTSYANYFGENVSITLVTPVKQGDTIKISDDVTGVGEQHYIVLQVGIS